VDNPSKSPPVHDDQASTVIPTQPIGTGKQIAANSALNIGTGVLILFLNLAFVPLLISHFGLDLFGVLSVTWMILANLAWLDLGFSRATARFVAQELAHGRLDQGARWCWSAVLTLFTIGTVVGVILFMAAPELPALLHVQGEKQQMVANALRIFAFALPIDLVARALIGVLQAGQRFRWTNGLDLSVTLATFAVYGVGILANDNFLVVVWGLLAARLLNLVCAYWGATRVLPSLAQYKLLGSWLGGYRRTALALVSYGWWVSLAALCGALLLYFDRWIIGLLIGVAVLPFYTVPMNLLQRLFLFPSSIVSTLFPAMSALHSKEEWGAINDYFVRSHRYVLVMLAPVLFLLFAWSAEILRLWISAEFSQAASASMRILVAGFAIALLAPMTGSLLEASGRPDILAKIYLVQLPVNVVLVYSLTQNFSLFGAAVSFAIRAFVETFTLWIVTYRILPELRAREFVGEARRTAPILLLMTVSAALIRGRIGDPATIAWTLVILLAFVPFAWFLVLDERDKSLIRGGWTRMRATLS
jgi:O-antigen/teichoic acid export membrane protein